MAKKIVIKKAKAGSIKTKTIAAKPVSTKADTSAEPPPPPRKKAPVAKTVVKQATPVTDTQPSSATPAPATKRPKPPIPPKASSSAPAAEPVSEAFKFYCVWCGQKLKATTAHCGQTIQCPSCISNITVPTPATE